MKVTPEDILKAFKGLAIAASRARELVDAHGRDGLAKGMARRQEDALRQLVIDVGKDVAAIENAFQNRSK